MTPPRRPCTPIQAICSRALLVAAAFASASGCASATVNEPDVADAAELVLEPGEPLLSLVAEPRHGSLATVPAATGELVYMLPTTKEHMARVDAGGIPIADSAKVSNASVVVATMAPGFRKCYVRGLADDGQMKGSVRITAKIGPNGEVLDARAGAGKGLSPMVTSCCLAVVASSTFDPPAGGAATVVIPVTLFPQPAGTAATPAPPAR